MGRKGNIGSQVVSCRVPTKLFTKLHNEADDKGIAIGVYIRDILSQENFSQGGETKIEYRDKLVPKIEYRDKIVEKIVEVPKIEYRDKIVEKIVEVPKIEYIPSPSYMREIEALEIENKSLIKDVQELKNLITGLRKDNKEMYEKLNPKKPFTRNN